MKRPEVEGVRESRRAFARARQSLTGPIGAAQVVRNSLELQRDAERLFADSLRSVKQITMEGSERARNAESDQSAAVQRVRSVSTIAFVLVTMVGLLTTLMAWAVGGCIRAAILSHENQQNDAARQMHSVMETIRGNTGSLRSFSLELSQSSQMMGESMQAVTCRAQQMEKTIADISETTQVAADVGEAAAAKTGEVFSAVQQLHASSVRISKITETIRGISFQTRILALNAAIEAARSGAHGAGFSVVANEVGTLAQAVADSVTEIEESVTLTQQEVAGTIQATKEIQAVIQQVRQMQANIAAQIAEQREATCDISNQIERAQAESAQVGSNAQRLTEMAVQLDRAGSQAEG